MACVVIGKWCVSTREAPPLQEVSYPLTQSEQGADSQPVGSSTALMTLEPLDLHWHTPQSPPPSAHTAQRPGLSQEGACTVSPHAHLYAMFEWPFYGSKDCWSAALLQGLCHFSLECGNTSSVVPKMQFTGDCFCMINIPEKPDAESFFRKEDEWVSHANGRNKISGHEWNGQRDGQMLAVSLKSRGVAQVDLCLHHVFELLWLFERERGERKQNHNTSS